ncbi:hypothetical protein CFY86_02610 [Raoultella ornithinolytica]|uniref:Uncharacterized protein n=1 Tax=Raoultella ornithinolytica TaxID=54291 RepID=A0A855FFT7_RAOOR|nr:hypothetical protein CFY86_02610 [Raoultella ornithinolytica]
MICTGIYIRHTSSCLCVGCARSPQSRTHVRSWGFTPWPPSCNSNYFGYNARRPCSNTSVLLITITIYKE